MAISIFHALSFLRYYTTGNVDCISFAVGRIEKDCADELVIAGFLERNRLRPKEYRLTESGANFLKRWRSI